MVKWFGKMFENEYDLAGIFENLCPPMSTVPITRVRSSSNDFSFLMHSGKFHFHFFVECPIHPYFLFLMSDCPVYSYCSWLLTKFEEYSEDIFRNGREVLRRHLHLSINKGLKLLQNIICHQPHNHAAEPISHNHWTTSLWDEGSQSKLFQSSNSINSSEKPLILKISDV
jgi:hypothetical protein